MKKHNAPDNRRLINMVALVGALILLGVALASLAFIRKAPPSITVISEATPTGTTRVVEARVEQTPSAPLVQPATPVPLIVVSSTATLVPVPLAVAATEEITAPVQPLLPDPAPPVQDAASPTAPPDAAVLPAAPPTAAPAKPAPTRQPDPNLLPNGVRYGDHKPNLPSRIVRIASPNIKLDTSVYEVYVIKKKNEWEVADYAAGHNYNSANPGEGGNIVLSGHNNWHGEVFRYLEKMKPGDLVQLWTLDGKEHDYRVTDTRKVKEAGVSMAQRLKNAQAMDPTEREQLTLITCWPYTTFTHRIIITALPVN